jgi:PAS domain S-box-containing protein
LERLIAEMWAGTEFGALTRFAVENATDMIMWIKPDAGFFYVNRTACRSLGYAADEIYALKLFDVDPDVTSENWPRAWARVASRRAYNFETTLRRKSGEIVPVEVSNYYLDHRDKQLCCSIVRDISERKRSEAELRRAKDAADKANLSKSRFLAATSHDLRQPLQSARLLHYALASEIADPARREVVDDLGLSLSVMGEMLDALLAISRLMAGEIAPRISEFAIYDLLWRISRALGSQADGATIELRLVPSSALVRSDPTLLGRAIENLVANALRHSRARKVLIGCRRRGGNVAIEVWDDGIGIPADKRETIFEEYVQLGAEADGRSRGLGLGLALVRRIAGMLGATVKVDSSVGSHTVFSLTAPLAARATPRAEVSGRVAVVIDNHVASAKAHAQALAERGMEVVVGASAAEAATTAKRQGLVPEVALVDYNLGGGGNGMEQIQRLRQRFGATLPCIVATRAESHEISRDCASMGVAVLAKPVELDALVAGISRLLASTPVGPRRPDATTPRRRRAARKRD